MNILRCLRVPLASSVDAAKGLRWHSGGSGGGGGGDDNKAAAHKKFGHNELVKTRTESRLISSIPDSVLSAQRKKTLQSLGATRLFPIQLMAYEPVLQGKNVHIKSQTGTGKTLSFVLPLVERCMQMDIAPMYHPHVVVLVPSWELADQVAADFRRLSTQTLAVVSLCGKESYASQKEALTRGADVVVATLGGFRHHESEGTLNVQKLTTLVVDEVESLLSRDCGELADMLRRIKRRESPQAASEAEKGGDDGNAAEGSDAAAPLPELQLILAGSTHPPWVKAITASHELMKDAFSAELTSVQDSPTNDRITHYYTEYKHVNKAPLIAYLIDRHFKRNVAAKVAVFSNRKTAVLDLSTAASLARFRPCVLLRERDRANERHSDYDRLLHGDTRVVLATDVASRGLNIPGLSLVINVETPKALTDYVYRAGRTGRAGQSGVVITLLSPGDGVQQLSLAARVDVKPLPVDKREMSKLLLDSSVERVQRTSEKTRSSFNSGWSSKMR